MNEAFHVPRNDSIKSTVSTPHNTVRPTRFRAGALPRTTNNSPSSSSTPIPRVYDPGESDRIKLAMVRLDVTDFPFRYHGSSSVHHVSIAIDGVRGFKDVEFLTRVKASMRREFWVPPIWDVTSTAHVEIRPSVTWPHLALERQLVEAYFDRIDHHLPLLDPITFRARLSGGLAMSDRRFSAVCWLVFANAARFIDETTTQYCGDTRSSGWAYFLSAKEAMADADRNRPTWLPETPDDVSLQVAVLTCTWLHGTVSPHIAWLLAGSALRASQELGLHIRAHSISSSSSSTEQHVVAARRAFWCLYHLDISHCASSGRRPVFSEGGFDFDPPLVLYGDAASSAFVQMLLLDRILSRTLDKLYSAELGSIDDVEALLKAADHWLFALPSFLRLPSEHLIGGPSIGAVHSFNIDNASLAIHYHYVRLLIRRPLLPRHCKPPLEQDEALSCSLEDCFAIADILYGLLQRDAAKVAITSKLMYPIWTVFVILHLSLEFGHYSGTVPSSSSASISEHRHTAEHKEIVTRMDVCVTAFSEIERRWAYAGKLSDWVSESMRSLCERFGDAFPSELHTKWSKSAPPLIEAMVGAGGTQYQTSGDHAFGGPFDNSAVDYDLIFEQLFGVTPWS